MSSQVEHLTTTGRDGKLAIRFSDGHWYTGLSIDDAKALQATEKEIKRALWLADQGNYDLPEWNGSAYYWPHDPSQQWDEADTIGDLVMIFGFSEADAARVLETSRAMFFIKD